MVELRRPRADEAAAVAALVNEHVAALGGPRDTTAEGITAWWSSENVEALVVDADGEIAGYGDLYVRAAHVRLEAYGAEAELVIAELEARAVGRHTVLRTVVPEHDPGRQLLFARGYRVVRDSYDMVLELAGAEMEPPVWPDGISPRQACPGDEPTFHSVQEDSFADHWGHHARSYEEWAHLYGTLRPFDPELWLLAEEGDESVGIAICERGVEGADEETGWIHVVGVRRPWRGRGLGLALLRWSLGALADAGMRRAALSVDAENTTGAVRLYERAGMHVIHRFETWEKRL
jgi:ribosomal protein S18 acetylase RimI-like enzyme